jgi:hypothetical protein
MPIIPASLSIVSKQFPEHRNTLERLFQQNETFRSLCEDFFDSVRAMNYWRGSEAGNAASLCEEYTDLVGDLTTEIAQWLADHGARS